MSTAQPATATVVPVTVPMNQCPVCEKAKCTTPGMGMGVLIGILVVIALMSFAIRYKDKNATATLAVGVYSLLLAIIIGAMIAGGKACE